MTFEKLIKNLIQIRSKRNNNEEVIWGTAFPIAPNKVLTARHVVADDNESIDVSQLTLVWWHKEKMETHVKCVAWDGFEDGQLDAVVLDCLFPECCQASNTVISRIPPGSKDIWYSEAFPIAGQHGQEEETVPMKGSTFERSPRNADCDMQLLVEGPALSEDLWSGASGAPIFVNHKVVGLLTNVPRSFGGNRFNAIAMERLLKIKQFCLAVSLPSPDQVEPITTLASQRQIAQELSKQPDLLKYLDVLLIKNEPESYKAIETLSNGSEAERWAHLLIKLPYDQAFEFLSDAASSCHGELDDSAKASLLFIVFLLTPVRFDKEKAERIKAALKAGDVDLIEEEIATALAAEIIMAGQDGRPIGLKEKRSAEKGYVGTNHVPLGVPFDIAQSPEDRLLKEITKHIEQRFLEKRGFSKRSDYVKQTLTAQTIEEEAKKGRTQYLVFDKDQDNLVQNKEDLLSLAGYIRRHYPHLAILLLSDDDDVNIKEHKQLYPIWDILEEIGPYD